MAQSSKPTWVRIRMFKELTEFPVVAHSNLKQFGEKIWILTGDSLKFNQKHLPTNNFVVRKANGRFDIISVLQFNDYLAGVVSNEMPLGWPLEALKAQAVVARSYALAKINERSHRFYHLESDQNDQVFLMNNSEKAKAAVVETDGIVLRGPSGAVLKAFYHADCGGKTLRASDVWGPSEVDSGTAEDPWCAERKSNQWSFEISKNDFLNKLKIPKSSEPRYFNTAKQVLTFNEMNFSIQKLREIFGYFRIRSAAKSVRVSSDRIQISGQGFGHGAGLCQWGTLSLIKQGKSYLDVLKHYYPRAHLSRNTVSN